jgi:heptosyltransferase-2
MSIKPSILDFKRIAILQTAFIGDVALTLPMVQSIKEVSPSSEIIFVTTPQSAELVSIANAVSHVITYDKKGLNDGLRGIKFISQLLNEKKVDCIISPHRSMRSALVTYYAKPEFSVTFHKSALSIIYDKRVKYKIHQHEIERNFSLLSIFENDFRLLELNDVKLDISDEDIDYVDSLFLNNSKKNIAIAPGSIWKTKRWLPDYFKSFIKHYSEEYNVILIGGKSDIDLCSEIASGTNAQNLAGKTTLAQSIHLLSKCNLLLTNDSSPTHLAGLANCPTATIYGPTSPRFGFSPRGESSISIVNDSLKCHPCHIHGKQVCPVKTHECMTSLNPDTVITKCDLLLQNQ